LIPFDSETPFADVPGILEVSCSHARGKEERKVGTHHWVHAHAGHLNVHFQQEQGYKHGICCGSDKAAHLSTSSIAQATSSSVCTTTAA
jgi:hypothetical protein